MIFVMDNSNMKSVLRLARTESDYKKSPPDYECDLRSKKYGSS